MVIISCCVWSLIWSQWDSLFSQVANKRARPTSLSCVYPKLCSKKTIQGLYIVAISESSISLPFLNFENPHQRICLGPRPWLARPGGAVSGTCVCQRHPLTWTPWSTPCKIDEHLGIQGDLQRSKGDPFINMCCLCQLPKQKQWQDQCVFKILYEMYWNV